MFLIRDINFTYFKRAVYKQLKKNKWIFYWFEWFKWHKEIQYQKQTNHAKDLKPNEQIDREVKLIRDYWKIGAFHYYRYGLQYKQLTDEQLLDYVPTYYFHKNIERNHVGIDTIMYGDKLTQALIFEERHICSPEVIAVYRLGKWENLNGTASVDIEKLIADKLFDSKNKLFFKPSGNCGGDGILVLKQLDGVLILNSTRIGSLGELYSRFNKSSTYIVQEKIIQSTQFNEINDSSVNTIRVVVQKEGEIMHIRTCILRMGRAGKEVDNSAQGGISIKIDPDTGLFAESATAEHGGGNIICHPDSGYVFKGKGVEDWGRIKRQIEDIANQLVDFKDVAMDIAITNIGAMIVEFNFRYGVEHQQCVLGGIRRIFNIPNC